MTENQEPVFNEVEENDKDPKNVSLVGGKLRSYVERIERLEDEKKELNTDINEIYAEAKGNGFSTKAIRAVIKLRKMTAADREEEDFLLEEYRSLLGL